MAAFLAAGKDRPHLSCLFRTSLNLSLSVNNCDANSDKSEISPHSLPKHKVSVTPNLSNKATAPEAKYSALLSAK